MPIDLAQVQRFIDKDREMRRVVVAMDDVGLGFGFTEADLLKKDWIGKAFKSGANGFFYFPILKFALASISSQVVFLLLLKYPVIAIIKALSVDNA